MRKAGQHLYIIQSAVTGAVKIGRSNDVEKRLKQLQTGSSYRLVLLAKLENYGHIEIILHKRLQKHKTCMQGEWFSYLCLPDLPDWIYEKLPFEDRWWKQD
jgi:hypothetical protein